MKKTLLLLTVMVVLASVSKGMEVGSSFDTPLIPSELYGIAHYEGPFVTSPTEIGFIVFGLTGAGIIAPFEATFYGYQLSFSQLPLTRQIGLGFFGRTGAYLFGLPFYIVKKLFWVGPVYLYEAVAGEDEAGEEAR